MSGNTIKKRDDIVSTQESIYWWSHEGNIINIWRWSEELNTRIKEIEEVLSPIEAKMILEAYIKKINVLNREEEKIKEESDKIAARKKELDKRREQLYLESRCLIPKTFYISREDDMSSNKQS